MIEKPPSAIELTTGSLRFLFGNFKLFLQSLILIVAITLGLNFITSLVFHSLDISMEEEILREQVKQASFWLKLLPIIFPTIIIGLFLHGCFVLSWHRMILKGLDKSYIVNPFSLSSSDIKFLKTFFFLNLYMFFLVFMWPVTIIFFNIIFSIFFAEVFNPIIIILLVAILSLIVMIPQLGKLLGYYFVLPVRSIGQEISYDKARDYSTGLKRKWVFGFIILGILYAILDTVLSFSVGLVFGNLISNIELSILKTILESIVSLPQIVLSFAFTACNVAILSYLYQWSKEYYFGEKI